MKIGMVSLGCAKNKVDAEQMMGALVQAGHEMTVIPQEADLIIVNTCGFIGSAKEEAIEAIFDMASQKRGETKLVVAGCFAQRYPQEILQEIPEVDAIWGIGEIGQVVHLAQELAQGGREARVAKPFTFGAAPRLLASQPHSAYLKIADGCDNRCTFCAIPGIRGDFLSRPMQEIVREALWLKEQGAREIVLIAQDTTRYGVDLYGQPHLTELIRELAPALGDTWIRTLYLYPEMIDEALLDAMAQSDNVCRYLDVPIQHVAANVLKRMGRRGGRAAIEAMYRLARDRGFTLRTTVLTGFPGESEAEFNELLSWLSDHPFDWLGAFAYSQEEGTPAAAMEGQLDEETKARREDAIMRAQLDITRGLLARRVGDVAQVLLDEVGEDGALGRSHKEAPEIDGTISIANAGGVQVGDIVPVKLMSSSEYDMQGVRL